MENQNKSLLLIKDLGMLYPTKTSKHKRRYSLYKCYCGNEFKAQPKDVKILKTKSCGCLKSERLKKYNIETKTIHNLASHRLYKTWSNMIRRCTNSKNKDYKHYGERGIKVCDEWLDINNFINDMFPSFIEGLTLDRENHLGNYEKSNCRWVNRITQAENTRKIRENNTSGFRGCCWHKKSNKWIAQIAVDKKHIYIGLFDNALDGAKAYDNYIIQNNLEHTKNF